MHKAKCEKADGQRDQHGNYHGWLKRRKNKLERHYVKAELKAGRVPENGYGKYSGYKL
jgi:hypothetical protein